MPRPAGHDRCPDRPVPEENVESVYHPVGTCKMGSDEMAVVDDRLRVGA